MKLFLFGVILFLSTISCFSQENSNDSRFYFHSYFDMESNSNVQDSLKLAIDSLNSLLFNRGTAKYQIDTNSNWELISLSSYNWEHVVGQEIWFQEPIKIISIDTRKMDTDLEDTIINIDKMSTENLDVRSIPLQINSNNKYFSPNTVVIFTGKEIYEFLIKHYKYPQGLDSNSIKQFPQILERNDHLNQRYIPIMSNNLMVLRYVHSYPDGSMTSFYHEEIYYFRKVELDGY